MFELLNEKEMLRRGHQIYASEIILAVEFLHKVGTQSRSSSPSELCNEAI